MAREPFKDWRTAMGELVDFVDGVADALRDTDRPDRSAPVLRSRWDREGPRPLDDVPVVPISPARVRRMWRVGRDC
jgi:hypothetical protein